MKVDTVRSSIPCQWKDIPLIIIFSSFVANLTSNGYIHGASSIYLKNFFTRFHQSISQEYFKNFQNYLSGFLVLVYFSQWQPRQGGKDSMHSREAGKKTEMPGALLSCRRRTWGRSLERIRQLSYFLLTHPSCTLTQLFMEVLMPKFLPVNQEHSFS